MFMSYFLFTLVDPPIVWSIQVWHYPNGGWYIQTSSFFRVKSGIPGDLTHTVVPNSPTDRPFRWDDWDGSRSVSTWCRTQKCQSLYCRTSLCVDWFPTQWPGNSHKNGGESRRLERFFKGEEHPFSRSYAPAMMMFANVHETTGFSIHCHMDLPETGYSIPSSA